MHQIDDAISKALKTWYEKDHPLHLDPLHPVIALAGEVGELLDLYKKEQFKDGVSWWDCAKCKKSIDYHYGGSPKYCSADGTKYTPKILDELGDLWYYIRILAYQSDADLSMWTNYHQVKDPSSSLPWLVRLNKKCAGLLWQLTDGHSNQLNEIDTNKLRIAFEHFQRLLTQLDYTLDELTELNWQKLRDGDNNGWAIARKLP